MRRFLAKMRGAGKAPARPPFDVIAWFGASAVLLFGMHNFPAAQPRNVIGGHILAALVGLILFTLLGDAWWVMALGIGGTIALMQLTRTIHPPAGANSIVIALGAADWTYLLAPVLLGVLTIVLVALVFNNIPRARKYPVYWW